MGRFLYRTIPLLRGTTERLLQCSSSVYSLRIQERQVRRIHRQLRPRNQLLSKTRRSPSTRPSSLPSFSPLPQQFSFNKRPGASFLSSATPPSKHHLKPALPPTLLSSTSDSSMARAILPFSLLFLLPTAYAAIVKGKANTFAIVGDTGVSGTLVRIDLLQERS